MQGIIFIIILSLFCFSRESKRAAKKGLLSLFFLLRELHDHATATQLKRNKQANDPTTQRTTLTIDTSHTMGGQVSKIMGKIFGSKEMRLLMLGLDAAGKTSWSLLFLFVCLVEPLGSLFILRN